MFYGRFETGGVISKLSIADRARTEILPVIDANRPAVPCITLFLLLLGPGTSITHAAVSALVVVPTHVGVNRA